MTTPRPVFVDADGAQWWDYLYEYDWDGKQVGFAICARSEAEANDRLKRLPLARYVGKKDHTYVPPIGGLFWVRLLTWWRNLGARPAAN